MKPVILLGVIGLWVFLNGAAAYGPRPMDDETYDTIMKCVKGEYFVPVKERTRAQKTAIVRFHRNRHRYGIGDDGYLTYNDKRVAGNKDISKRVEQVLKLSKGSGARKLKHRIGAQYCGVAVKERERQDRAKKENHRRKYLIELTHQERIEDAVLPIQLDPPGDGNCQFSAIADQLRDIGIYRSAQTLRKEIVVSLLQNPFNSYGTHLSHYVDGNNFERYIRQMAKDGAYGDHITMQRCSDIFNVQIVVYSSLGQMATQIITPLGAPVDPNIKTLFLYHMAEGHGDHFLSLVCPNRPLAAVERDTYPEFGTASDEEAENGKCSDLEDHNRPDGYSDSIEQPDAHASTSRNIPPEMLDLIIEYTLSLDIGMMTVFNKVSKAFQRLTAKYYPRLHISEFVAQILGITRGCAHTMSVVQRPGVEVAY